VSEKKPLVNLVSSDAVLINRVRANAAAVGVSLAVVIDPVEIRRIWYESATVLIGADQSAPLVAWALPKRPRCFLLGQVEQAAQLCASSAPLGACVITLPEGGNWLTRVIDADQTEQGEAQVVRLSACVGGLGSSTVAAGLALAAAQRGLRVALVDDDPYGGGLDLVLGAEQHPGWRWDKLAAASGQLADVSAQLVATDGVHLLSYGRVDPKPIDGEAKASVLDGLVRTMELVIIDQGRWRPEAGELGAKQLILSSLTMRSSAALMAALAQPGSRSAGVLVRRLGSGSVTGLAQLIGRQPVATVPTVRDLPTLADRGVPPIMVRRWRRLCNSLLDWSLTDGQLAWRPPVGPVDQEVSRRGVR
jgi:secretion/DNA translocation related CpaE-like protein